MIGVSDRPKFVELLKAELWHRHNVEFPCEVRLFEQYRDEDFCMMFKAKDVSIKHPEPMKFHLESFNFKEMRSIYEIAKEVVVGNKCTFIGSERVKNDIELCNWLSVNALNFIRLYLCTNCYAVKSFNNILIAMDGSIAPIESASFVDTYSAVKTFILSRIKNADSSNTEFSKFKGKKEMKTMLEIDAPTLIVQDIIFLV